MSETQGAGWRPTADGVGWRDGGKIELLYADGRIARVTLGLDAFFNGEDEIPVPTILDSEISFFDAEAWRPVKAGS